MLGSLGAGAALSIEVLIAFHFVQGASAAALHITTAAIVSDAFPKRFAGEHQACCSRPTAWGSHLAPSPAAYWSNGVSFRRKRTYDTPHGGHPPCYFRHLANGRDG